jgi:hypothetical protein
MEASCEYIEKVVANRRQGMAVQLGAEKGRRLTASTGKKTKYHGTLHVTSDFRKGGEFID